MNPKVEQYYIKHQITDYTYIPYTFITETYHLANIIVSRFQVQDQLVQFQLEIDKAKTITKEQVLNRIPWLNLDSLPLPDGFQIIDFAETSNLLILASDGFQALTIRTSNKNSVSNSTALAILT